MHTGSATEPPKGTKWIARPTIRNLKKKHSPSASIDLWRRNDDKENARHRLPPDEQVNLGGLTLVEAFPPSSVSRLYSAISRLPGQSPETKRRRLIRIEESRSATGREGWESLGCVRHPGASIFSSGFHDPELPIGVSAVWLRLYYLIPSTVILVATFTLEEDAGDLSEILRKDYSTELCNERMEISGRLTRIRSKISWVRPKRFSTSHSFYTPQFQKVDACEDAISTVEANCWKWISKRFPGRFSVEPPKYRPGFRVFLTKDSEPFESSQQALSLVGLGLSVHKWSAPEFPGWSISFDNWRARSYRPFQAVAAARRSTASAKEDPADDGASVWTLTHDFHEYQSSLAVRWAMSCLLSLYSHRLGRLRDRSATRQRFDRPVRQARELDQFLLGDGLDAATVASEVRNFAASQKSFRYDFVEYFESSDLPDETVGAQTPRRKDRFVKTLLRAAHRKSEKGEKGGGVAGPRKASELTSMIRESLTRQSGNLMDDMRIATTNIGASAGLRQAIANTRMQRAVVLLAIIATGSGILGACISILR